MAFLSAKIRAVSGAVLGEANFSPAWVTPALTEPGEGNNQEKHRESPSSVGPLFNFRTRFESGVFDPAKFSEVT
jgi:hypothetical protein